MNFFLLSYNIKAIFWIKSNKQHVDLDHMFHTFPVTSKYKPLK